MFVNVYVCKSVCMCVYERECVCVFCISECMKERKKSACDFERERERIGLGQKQDAACDVLRFFRSLRERERERKREGKRERG